MSEERIDGHIQFTGGRWQFFLTKQEGLPCETPDCSTCKAATKKYLDGLDAEAKTKLDAEKAEEKARIEAAAKVAAEQKDQMLADKAGGLKHEAIRLVNLAKAQGCQKIEDETVEALAQLERDFNEKKLTVMRNKESRIFSLEESQMEALKGIEEKDWKAEALRS